MMKLKLFLLLISFQVFAGGIIGQKAEEINDVKWQDKNGKSITIPSIKEHKGKFVILKFWQSWCPGCLSKGLPDLKKLQDHFKNNKDVALYSAQTVFEGFSVNHPGKIKKIRDRFSLDLPMAHDDGKTHKEFNKSVLMSRYKAGGTPWFVIIDPRGVVVFNDFHLNTDQVIKLIDSKTKETKNKKNRS